MATLGHSGDSCEVSPRSFWFSIVERHDRDSLLGDPGVMGSFKQVRICIPQYVLNTCVSLNHSEYKELLTNAWKQLSTMTTPSYYRANYNPLYYYQCNVMWFTVIYSTSSHPCQHIAGGVIHEKSCSCVGLVKPPENTWFCFISFYIVVLCPLFRVVEKKSVWMERSHSTVRVTNSNKEIFLIWLDLESANKHSTNQHSAHQHSASYTPPKMLG